MSVTDEPLTGREPRMREELVCPSCGRAGLREFARVERVPVHNSLVLGSPDEARAFPRGDVELAFCEHCAFITNPAYDASKIRYYPEYEDQQSFSPTFNAFAASLAQELIDRYDLRGKRILEIGCGKGDFLALICELGGNDGVGIDPTALAGRLEGAGADRVTLISDLYSERYAAQTGDLVCCRHTLEHIPDTRAFLRMVRAAIGDRHETVVFFEVPDVLRVLDETAYWDVYYEHCSYFTPGSLARLFRECGFEVERVRLGFDDQYILLEARPVAQRSERYLPQEEPIATVAAAVEHYSRALREGTREWRSHLEGAARAGRKVAIWGSGSKCVAFLTTLGLTDEIACVVDINPHRQGKYLLGAGLRVQAPEALIDVAPDEIVVMNPIYVPEIKTMLQAMNVVCEVRAV